MMNINIPETISNQILKLVSKISNKNLLRIIELLEKFGSAEYHKKGAAAIKKMIEDDHQGIQATRRILQNLNPKARAGLLNNFMLGNLLLGYRKRLEFWNEHQVPPPGTLMISPTLKCNLRCFGCYAATHEHKNELTREEVENLIVEAGKTGTNYITLLGGEPFTVPWLIDVMEKFNKTAFQVFTNGLLLDDEKIAKLATLGNVALFIGIDGLEKETDARKGKGAYKGALKAIKKLSDAGLPVGYSTMVSSRNIDEIYSDEFMDTMIAHGAGFGWAAVAIPQGKACKETQLIPSAEQKARIKDLVRNVRRNKPIILIDFYSDGYLTEGCGAGRTTIHVNANGDVEPCVLFPFAVDNIRDKSYTEIIKSDFFKGLRKVHKRYPGEMQTCMMVFKPKDVIEVLQEVGAKETSKGTLEQLHAMAKEQEN
jgi:MoaA/NifB/PqqE/SkfB family radical SAM enzyme